MNDATAAPTSPDPLPRDPLLDLIERRPNVYGFSGLDRSAHIRERDAWLEELLAKPDTRLVPVWRTRSLVVAGDGTEPAPAILTTAEHGAIVSRAHTVAFLGEYEGVAHVGIDLSPLDEEFVAEQFRSRGSFVDLRTVGPVLSRFESGLLAYARGLMWWHQRHQHCGVCGAPTASVKGGHQRGCTNESCKAPVFPRTDPAVIMLVHDGDRALLGRQAVWPEGRYSTLAGFVEPGETLEEAVAREVWEETNIRVRRVRYHSSQPWPFPSSIMLGFHAEATSTDIRRNDEEIQDAQWFTREEILDFGSQGKHLPSRDSIARRLVEDWLEGNPA